MDNLGFNMFDAVVIGLIVLLSIKGLLNGFTKELFNAIGLIGGLFIASYYKNDLATYLHDNFLDSLSMPLLSLLSLLAIFIGVFILAKVIYKIIESISNRDYISGASRLAGMLIKMITLYFVFSLIVFGLSSKPQVVNKFKDTLNKSKLYPLLKDSGALILNAHDIFNNTIKGKEKKEPTKESNVTVSENNKTKESKEAIKEKETPKLKEEKKETQEHKKESKQKKEDKDKNSTSLNKTPKEIEKEKQLKPQAKSLSEHNTTNKVVKTKEDNTSKEKKVIAHEEIESKSNEESNTSEEKKVKFDINNKH